jgi:hypothetical protein
MGVLLGESYMSNQPTEIKKERDPKSVKPAREKEVSTTQQSSDEPSIEKSSSRQRRPEVQNPLMHESY